MLLKRIVCALSAFFVAVSVIGCTDKKSAQSEDVVLKYIMVGPAGQEDQRMVFDEFNRKLQEKIPGVSIDFEIIAASDYKQRFMLIQAGGEKVDIVGTYGLDFQYEVENQTFISLDELLDKYAKETKEILPDWLFDYMKVDGKIYGIPAYQQIDTPYGIFMQKKYADKYMDIEKFKNALQSKQYTAVYDMIDDYAQKLLENGEIGLGLDCGMITSLAYENLKSNFVLERQGDKKYKVLYQFMSDVYKEQYERTHNWYKKGYIRKDVMTASDQASKKFLDEGGYVMWSDQIGPEDPSSERYQNFYQIPLSDHYRIPSSSAAGGVAIMASCEYPDKAMQVLNLLHSNKELYNLLSYGIEGVHYKKLDENKIEVPYNSTQGSINDKYGLYRWIIGNTEISYDTQYDTELIKNWVFNEVNKAEEKSDFIGFNLNTSNIQNQIDQIAAIKGQYMGTLANGVSENWQEQYAEWMTKLDAVGIDKVIQEIQKQVDEFLENK